MSYNNELLKFLKKINDHNIKIYFEGKMILENTSLFAKINIKSEWPGLEPYRKNKKQLVNYYNKLLTDPNWQEFLTCYSILSDYCLKCVSRNNDTSIQFPHSKDGIFINLSTHPGNNENFYILQLLAFFEVLDNDWVYTNWLKTNEFINRLFESDEFIENGIYPYTFRGLTNKSEESAGIVENAGEAPDMGNDTEIDDLRELVDILLIKNIKYKKQIELLNKRIKILEDEHEETIHLLMEEHGKVLNKIREEHDMEVGELRSIIDLLNERISTLEGNISSLPALELYNNLKLELQRKNNLISVLENENKKLHETEKTEHEYQNLLERTDNLERELQEQRRNNENVNLIITELQNRNLELTDINNELNNKNVELDQLLENLYNRYTQLNTTNKELQIKNQELEDNLNEAETAIAELKDEKDDMEYALNQVENLELVSMIQKLENEIQILKNNNLEDVEYYKKEIVNYETRIYLMDEEYQNMYSQWKASYDAKVNSKDVSIQTTPWKQTRSSQTESIVDLVKLDNLKDSYIKASLDVQEIVENEIREFREEHLELIERLNQANKTIEELTSDLDIRYSEYRTLSELYHTEQSNRLSSSRDNYELSKIVKRFTIDNEALTTELNQTRNIYNTTSERLLKTEQNLNETNERLLATEQNLKETRERLVNTEERMREVSLTVADQLNQLAYSEDRIRRLSVINEANENEFRMIIRNMQEELDARSVRNELLSATIINIMQEKENLQKIDNENNALFNYIKNAIGYDPNLNTDLPIREYIIQVIKRYKNLSNTDIDALQMLNRELSQQLKSIKNTVGDFEEYKKISEQEYSEIQKRLLQALSDNELITEKANNKAMEISSGYDAEISRLKFEIEKLNNEYDIIILENGSVKDNYRLLLEENKLLREKVLDLKDEISFDKDYYKKIITDYADTQQELNSYREMLEEENRDLPEGYTLSKREMYSLIQESQEDNENYKKNILEIIDKNAKLQLELENLREDVSMYKYKYKTMRKAFMEANSDRQAMRERQTKIKHEPKLKPKKDKKNIEYVDIYDSNLLSELDPDTVRSANIEESKAIEVEPAEDPKQLSMRSFLKRLGDYEEPARKIIKWTDDPYLIS